MKIIAGAHQADGGQLLMDGKPVHPANPRAAQELGIATVFQNLGVIDHLNATENCSSVGGSIADRRCRGSVSSTAARCVARRSPTSTG